MSVCLSIWLSTNTQILLCVHRRHTIIINLITFQIESRILYFSNMNSYEMSFLETICDMWKYPKVK